MKIFYHNDNDGKAAAAAIYMYIKYVLDKKVYNDDFIEVDYSKSVPNYEVVKPNEIVFIVDYSFTDNTLEQLMFIRSKTKNIYWMDHHNSSFEVLQKVKDETLVKYVELDTGRCGAKIAYDFLIKKLSDTKKEELSNILRNFKDKISLVDDYDRWLHYKPESTPFNIGSSTYDTTPTSNFWIEDNIEYVVKIGEAIKSYKDKLNETYCNNYSYECTINGYKCIVLNTPESSSQAFVDLYDKYHLAIRYVFDGSIYKYSIYSELEDIDCSKIAKKAGNGGGHKGAAGFTSIDLLFKDGGNYNY